MPARWCIKDSSWSRRTARPSSSSTRRRCSCTRGSSGSPVRWTARRSGRWTRPPRENWGSPSTRGLLVTWPPGGNRSLCKIAARYMSIARRFTLPCFSFFGDHTIGGSNLSGSCSCHPRFMFLYIQESCFIQISFACQDPRFFDAIDQETGYKTRWWRLTNNLNPAQVSHLSPCHHPWQCHRCSTGKRCKRPSRSVPLTHPGPKQEDGGGRIYAGRPRHIPSSINSKSASDLILLRSLHHTLAWPFTTPSCTTRSRRTSRSTRWCRRWSTTRVRRPNEKCRR